MRSWVRDHIFILTHITSPTVEFLGVKIIYVQIIIDLHLYVILPRNVIIQLDFFNVRSVASLARMTETTGLSLTFEN